MYNKQLQFHFVGIGGSGMSGIAEILLKSGFQVSGSDLQSSATCLRLEQLGAKIAIGHSEENLPDSASLLVYSSAVDFDNPEIRAATARDLPIVRRAEVLAELMRLKFSVAVAGSHGKTTTTTMLGWILHYGECDPTIIVGGRVQHFGTGGWMGNGSFLVAEADESDRSFLMLKPSVAIITNVDREHLSAYRDEADLRDSFKQFASSIPFYGLLVVCADDPFLRELAASFSRRKILYGFSEDSELRGEVIDVGIAGTHFRVWLQGVPLMEVRLPFIGRHFALNALAAIAVALEFGIAPEKISSALAECPRVDRRLELVGEVNGITVMSDYGHHPVEIEATLSALDESFRSSGSRLIVVFQPHRYTRTEECYHEFLKCFSQADFLIVTDIYSAGEAPIENISAERFFRDLGHPSSEYVSDMSEISSILISRTQPNDLVLFLGAGSIGRESQSFLSELQSTVVSLESVALLENGGKVANAG